MDTFGLGSARFGTERHPGRATTPPRCSAGRAFGRHRRYTRPEGKGHGPVPSNPDASPHASPRSLRDERNVSPLRAGRQEYPLRFRACTASGYTQRGAWEVRFGPDGCVVRRQDHAPAGLPRRSVSAVTPPGETRSRCWYGLCLHEERGRGEIGDAYAARTPSGARSLNDPSHGPTPRGFEAYRRSRLGPGVSENATQEGG